MDLDKAFEEFKKSIIEAVRKAVVEKDQPENEEEDEEFDEELEEEEELETWDDVTAEEVARLSVPINQEQIDNVINGIKYFGGVCTRAQYQALMKKRKHNSTTHRVRQVAAMGLITIYAKDRRRQFRIKEN